MADLVTCAGCAAIVTGCVLLAPWLGWIVGGVLLVAIGIRLHGSKKPTRSSV